ncbi:MAG: cytidine deaminase [Bacillota bacterium]|nr:cytidine deaminase [Bacillota bacterium]
MEDRELFLMAAAAAEKAYAPYSGFRVGAALLAKDGRVFTGVNVENASYGAGICAERTAAVKAVSEGCREFSALAVASPDGEAWPCGICRQFLYEFGDTLRVITGPDPEQLEARNITELLPKGFRL